MAKYLQNFFKPQNPKKYKGDKSNIVYRSSWELSFMRWLDTNPAVTLWSSEEIIVYYISPLDGRKHRYFPDFYFECKDADGKTKKYLIEVKPYAQTIEPKKKEKKTKQYINEVTTWAKNSSKWAAAREYCRHKGYEFQIITEKDLKL